jgi:uncharacterized protein
VTTPSRAGRSSGSTLRSLVEAHRDEIERIADKYGFTNIRLFGSVARGEDRANSDIDFLVDLPEDATLFQLAGFRRELQELLRMPVDVVSSRALLPRDYDVLDDAVAL